VGGVVGPVLLMLGLATKARASRASRLLNLEGRVHGASRVVRFQRELDARIALGMALIATGSIVLFV